MVLTQTILQPVYWTVNIGSCTGCRLHWNDEAIGEISCGRRETRDEACTLDHQASWELLLLTSGSWLLLTLFPLICWKAIYCLLLLVRYIREVLKSELLSLRQWKCCSGTSLIRTGPKYLSWLVRNFINLISKPFKNVQLHVQDFLKYRVGGKWMFVNYRLCHSVSSLALPVYLSSYSSHPSSLTALERVWWRTAPPMAPPLIGGIGRWHVKTPLMVPPTLS